MRRYRKTALATVALSLALVFGGCTSSLDQAPTLTLSSEDIYNSQDRIEGVIKGIYSAMKNNGSIGNRTYVIVENIGDDMKNVSGNVSNEYLESYEMVVGMNSVDNTGVWSSSYSVINNVNTALEGLESHRQVAADKYEAFREELLFQRALAYFYLNFFYAKPYLVDSTALSVPLRLKAESSLDDEDLAPSTNAEVYRQILADTKDYQALPVGGGTEEKITRASQGAVLLLRQRVLMAMGQWSQAVEAGEAIEQQGYALDENAKGPFSSSPTCPESIFSFPQAQTDYGGGHQQSVSYFLGNGKSLVLDRGSGIHSGLYPAYNLEKDKRISQLVTPKNGQELVGKYNDDVNYQDWVVLFRYAEVKLNLAESYCHTGQEDKARKELLEVRRRAIAADDDPLDINTLTGEALLEAVYNERRAEFVGEAIRAIDIKRRGENFVKCKGTAAEWTVTPAMDGYTWPIPETERTNNHAIGN